MCALNASLRVQVAVCPEILQLQPFPLAAVPVNPAGMESLTVTVPLVATSPPLVTVTAKLPTEPRTKVGELAVVATVRFGTPLGGKFPVVPLPGI